MTSTGIRDLKNNLSRYIRRLKPGSSIIVTDRGRVVAELRAPDDSKATRALPDRFAALVASGIIRPAVESGDPMADWPSARQISLPPGSAAALIDEDRG